MVNIDKGVFVRSPHGVAIVHHLALKKDDKPTAACVVFPSGFRWTYPLEMLSVITEEEYAKIARNENGHEPKEEVITPAAQEMEPVWRWCAVCFVRTEHVPAASPAGFLQCTVCGHRVIKTAPDRSKEFAVPADDVQPSVVVTEHDR